ncbi:hypothetical protein Tco_0813913 [Tanacetum coccineum]
MSDSEHSTVTYTSLSEDDLYMGSPGVEVPIYEGPPSPDYVPGPEEPEQAPPSPIYVPFVPEPVYPEFLPVDDEVFPAEEQPLGKSLTGKINALVNLLFRDWNHGSTQSEVHTADQLPLPRYGLDAPPARAGLSDGYDRTIDPGIVPIGLADSGNLFCIIAFSSYQSLIHECDSLAGRSPTYRTIKKCLLPLRAIGLRARVLNISLAFHSEPERISDRLEDPVSHAPLAFNSQGEHSEVKPALAFSTPTGISLGGSSEPLTLSPDHKPLGGCEPNERLDGMKLDQRERKHDQSDLVSEAGRE